MKALLLTAALLLPSLTQAAEFDLTVSAILQSNEDINTAPELKIRYGNDLYGWASWSRHNQVMTTQALGGLDMFGAGLGYRETFGKFTPFIEIGAGYLSRRKAKDIVDVEAVYYRLVPIFGIPPFQDGIYFDRLPYKYNLKPDVVATLGARWDVSSRIGIEVAYKYFMSPEYFAYWNPEWNGGPETGLWECGCFWHGDGRLDMSSVSVGVNWRW